MSSTNLDASLTTARRRQLALVGWRQGTNYPANPNTVKAEQAPGNGFQDSGLTSTVPLNAYVGAQLIGQTSVTGCACNPSVTLAGYVKKSPGC